MLRLTTTLFLLALPLFLTRLMSYHQRSRPPTSIFNPNLDAVVVSAFPIAWFFGFLYYTEVPSLVFVVATVAAAVEGKHWQAGLVSSS
jgi:alpha-1,2-glucosyltransferase